MYDQPGFHVRDHDDKPSEFGVPNEGLTIRKCGSITRINRIVC